jgi:hypothetical protein
MYDEPRIFLVETATTNNDGPILFLLRSTYTPPGSTALMIHSSKARKWVKVFTFLFPIIFFGLQPNPA